MGEKLNKYKEENINNYRVGACAELIFYLDNIDREILRIKEFLKENEELFNNQKHYEVSTHFDALLDVVTSSVDILLNDIDPDENYCNYLKRYYWYMKRDVL